MLEIPDDFDADSAIQNVKNKLNQKRILKVSGLAKYTGEIAKLKFHGAKNEEVQEYLSSKKSLHVHTTTISRFINKVIIPQVTSDLKLYRNQITCSKFLNKLEKKLSV